MEQFLPVAYIKRIYAWENVEERGGLDLGGMGIIWVTGGATKKTKPVVNLPNI